MIILDATDETLELELSAAISVDWNVSYADHTTTLFTPAGGEGNHAAASTTMIVAAPAAATQRQVKFISLMNKDALTPVDVTLKKDKAATDRHIIKKTLTAGQSLIYNEGAGFHLTP